MADINGTENADDLDGTNDNDRISGLGGADTITGGQGADRIDGGVGDDQLNGGQGSDLVIGGEGDDRLTDNADGGDDKLFGGDGNDIIAVSRTSAGKDKIQIDGGAGADTITFTSNAGNKSKLVIDGGFGANNISVEEAKEIDIDTGRDVDTISLETGVRSFVHSGGSADLISASAAQASARTGISTGKGADQVTLDINTDARYRLKLGEGQDVVTLTAEGDTASDFKVKFKDFTAGDAGDKLDLDAYLASVLEGATGSNAFASGHLRLVQVGDDAVLQLDRDGDGAAFGFEDVVWFQGSTAANFTAFNFDGLDPTPEAAAPGDDYVV